MNELLVALDGIQVLTAQLDPVSAGIMAAMMIIDKLKKGGEGSSPTSTAEQRALQQQMLRLIKQQQGYMSQMDPLREAMLRMAGGMLPTRYQPGPLKLPDIPGGGRQPWRGLSGRSGPKEDNAFVGGTDQDQTGFERRQF